MSSWGVPSPCSFIWSCTCVPLTPFLQASEKGAIITDAHSVHFSRTASDAMQQDASYRGISANSITSVGQEEGRAGEELLRFKMGRRGDS